MLGRKEPGEICFTNWSEPISYFTLTPVWTSSGPCNCFSIISKELNWKLQWWRKSTQEKQFYCTCDFLPLKPPLGSCCFYFLSSITFPNFFSSLHMQNHKFPSVCMCMCTALRIHKTEIKGFIGQLLSGFTYDPEIWIPQHDVQQLFASHLFSFLSHVKKNF